MPGFDRVAGIYRWGEAITFGPLLMRTRMAWLPALSGATRLLVLGDGDGRFTAAALALYPDLHITAVDSSAAMLASLRSRCRKFPDRLVTVLQDVRSFVPAQQFDAVCAHFLLDCLIEDEIESVVDRLSIDHWIVSEFDIPQGVMRWPARVLVRVLYAAFGVLAGLRVQKLPDWRAAFRRCRYVFVTSQTHLGGILVSEIWSRETGERVRASERVNRNAKQSDASIERQ